MLFHRTAVRVTAFALCAVLAGVSASADGGGEPVFALTGICVTDVPEGGAVLLGDRVIRGGDVLTAAQVRLLTYTHPETGEDIEAVMEYLPIDSDGVGAEARMVFSLRGRKNAAPTAEDSRMETYKNLPNEGLLSVTDPEGDAMTFTLVRPPKRGELILRDDGSFLYTPKKNKVGTDSFTYTAADSAGNVSEEATVTIDILKPTDERQYTDTASTDCRFEAEWLRNTGIFSGETVNGQFCFSPEEPVSRGQFLAMLMQVLDMPVDRTVTETGFLDESPQWLRPYLAAALRSGIITGYPARGGVEFRANQPVSADEAAVMVRNALEFAVPAAAMDQAGSELLGLDPLTRAGAARALYQVSRLRRGSGLFGLFR
ncbi:MAG: S-layer homology domain-containing protein [Oscillospiraceae bacterium]|nr:S-layer homology domain-containing protein [Oscillospiraceae bacterium]